MIIFVAYMIRSRHSFIEIGIEYLKFLSGEMPHLQSKKQMERNIFISRFTATASGSVFNFGRGFEYFGIYS